MSTCARVIGDDGYQFLTEPGDDALDVVPNIIKNYMNAQTR